MTKKNMPHSRVPSPCISVCSIDEDTGYCRGCWRNLAEIGGWDRYDDTQKKEVISKLEPRRTALGQDDNCRHC